MYEWQQSRSATKIAAGAVPPPQAWLALGILAALGCAEPRQEVPGVASDGADASAAQESLGGGPLAGDDLDVQEPSWAERLRLERATADGNTDYHPVPDGAALRVARPGGWSASVGEEGATLTLGQAVEAEVAVVHVGRVGGAAMELSPRRVFASGADALRELAPGVREWWRALPSGLEHGLTLDERPAGEGALVVEVAFRGLVPRALSSTAISLEDEAGSEVASYAHLLVLDAAGGEVPAQMVAEEGGVRLEVEDEGARYPLLVDPIIIATEETILEASDGVAADYLGFSVSLSADGQRALVGVPGNESARVFVRSPAGWTEEATLTAPTISWAFFGNSVSLDAGGTRALVGAYQDGDRTAARVGTGTAWVFLRSGTVWTLEARLASSSPVPYASFGWSVSISADGTRVLVGVESDDIAGVPNSGSAGVFVRAGSTWSEEALLTLSGARGNDHFGSSVSLSSDGSTALVGAPEDVSGGSLGSVRVFVRAGSGWTAAAALRGSGRTGADGFGRSVSMSGDGSRALVGAGGDDSAGSDAGRAWVFARSGSVWSEEASLVASGGAAGDRLGLAVSLNGDGSRALVAAPFDRVAGVQTGSARLFVRAGSAWTERFMLSATGGAAGDRFGWAIALNGDGARVLVGAPHTDTTSGGGAGRAHVFTFWPLATPCAFDRECITGHCVDGVCCATECGGGVGDCRACSLAAGGTEDGLCTPLSATSAPTVLCRPSAGSCDATEHCASTSSECPEDRFAPTTTECRPAGGPCGVAEVCTGFYAGCPPDRQAPRGLVCRLSADICDAPESCDGSTPECPEDAFADPTNVCRPSAGDCDLIESCSGRSPECPEDVFASPLSVCRRSAGVCDEAESCSGISPACPEDVFRPSMFACGEGRCADGVETPARTCTGEGAACPPEMAAECGPYACGVEACLGECASDVECAPTFVCDGGLCVPADAGLMADAGVADAGVASTPRGCGCSVPRPADDSPGLVLVIFVALALRRVRRHVR